MKENIKIMFMFICLILNSACTVKHPCMIYKYEKNIEQGRLLNYVSPKEYREQIKQVKVPLNEHSVKSQMLYQIEDPGTNSTGPR